MTVSGEMTLFVTTVENWTLSSTVEHDFNGHEVNGIHGVNGKKYHDGGFL